MKTANDMTIGKRLRQLRHERGLSIAELARAAQLTESTVYRLEAEGRKPRADTLQALSRALEVTTDELLGLDPIEARVEAPDLTMVKLPVLSSPADLQGEAAETMEVPAYVLPADVDRDVLAVVLPGEAAPVVRPDDLVIAARDRAWEDEDIVLAVDGDLVIRRAYHEPGGDVLIVGRDMSDRARVASDAVVARIMTYTRRM